MKALHDFMCSGRSSHVLYFLRIQTSSMRGLKIPGYLFVDWINLPNHFHLKEKCFRFKFNAAHCIIPIFCCCFALTANAHFNLNSKWFFSKMQFSNAFKNLTNFWGCCFAEVQIFDVILFFYFFSSIIFVDVI